MNEEILERIINGKKHILVSGQKESGKTSNVMFPIVDKLIAKKESLLVLDYKKEFVATTYNKLKENNYNIIVLDFDLADETDGWDPLSLTKYFYLKDKTSVKANRAFRLLCANLAIPFKVNELVQKLFNENKPEDVNLELIYDIAKAGPPSPQNMSLRGPLEGVFVDEKSSNMLRKTTFSYDDILNKPTAIFIVNNIFNARSERMMNTFFNQLLCLFNYEHLENKMNIIAENCDVFNRYYDYANIVYNFLNDNVRLIYSVRSAENFAARNGKQITSEFNHIILKRYTIELYVDGFSMDYPYNFKQVNVTTSNFKYKKLDKVEKSPIQVKAKSLPTVDMPKPVPDKYDNLKDVSDEDLNKMLEQLNKELEEINRKAKEAQKNSSEVEKQEDNITKEEHKPIEMPVPPKMPEETAKVEEKTPEAEPEVKEEKTEGKPVEPPVAPEPPAVPTPPAPVGEKVVEPKEEPAEEKKDEEPLVIREEPAPAEIKHDTVPAVAPEPTPAEEKTPEAEPEVKEEPVEEKPVETPAVPETPAEPTPEATIKPPSINTIDTSKELAEASKILEQKLENHSDDTNEPTIVMEKIDINKINN